MPNLGTDYLGLSLRNPLVCSSSPLSESLDDLAAMEEAGAGAIVLHSLFEEQIELEGADLDRFLDLGAESHPEALDYFPDMSDYNLGVEGYLEHLREAKALVKIPLVASLNGKTRGGWVRFARDMEQAGADALELNLYFLPTDADRSSSDVEAQYLDLVAAVRSEIRIPLAVKLSPFFTSPAHFGKRLAEAGANGLVLFNRFYQPDFNLEALDVTPTLHLSTPQELLLRLHWVAILFGSVPADLAVTGGVHSALDVLKSMMAGAKVAMTTSALYKHGIGHLRTVLHDLERWMTDHEYESIRQMQGSMSLRRVAHPSAFERANYLRVLRTYAMRQ